MPDSVFLYASYSQCRSLVCEPGHSGAARRNSFYVAHIVKSGRGEFVHGESKYPLQAGDLFLARPDVFHLVRAEGSRGLKLYFLRFYLTRHFNQRQVNRQMLLKQDELNRFLVHSHVHQGDQFHLVPLFEHAKALNSRKPEFPNNPHYHDASLLLLNQVFSALNSDAEISSAHYGDLLLRNRIISYIEQHLSRNLKISEIADACGMSERNLRRKWKSGSTRTLVQEIAYRRIERACQLLLLPEVTLAGIAEEVGVADTAQFSRLFRSIKSIPPGAFRRHHLQHVPDAAAGFMPFVTEYQQ